jgi:hypothetical protein
VDVEEENNAVRRMFAQIAKGAATLPIRVVNFPNAIPQRDNDN